MVNCYVPQILRDQDTWVLLATQACQPQRLGIFLCPATGPGSHRKFETHTHTHTHIHTVTSILTSSTALLGFEKSGNLEQKIIFELHSM